MRAIRKALLFILLVLVMPTIYTYYHEKSTDIDTTPVYDDKTYYYQNNMYENNVGENDSTAIISKMTNSAANKNKTAVKDKNSKIAKYCLKNLTEDERRVYNQIYDGITSYEPEITITGGVLTKDSINDFVTYLTCTEPQINNLAENYGIYTDYKGFVNGLKMTYSRTRQQGTQELKELNNALNELIKNTIGMSDSEKVKYFHDSIVQRCDYDKNSSSRYSAYGCLVEGKAVCEGYSKAMSMLCSKAGIPCINVIGTATDDYDETQSHMWNMVEIDNKWYHIDVTWDDPRNGFGSDYVRYDYFNVDDKSISIDHEMRMTRYMAYPSATSLDENYFVSNGLYIYNSNNALPIIQNALALSLENSDKYVRVKCESAEKFEAVKDEFFTDNSSKFFDVLKQMVQNTYPDVKIDSFAIAANPKTYVITVQLKSNTPEE